MKIAFISLLALLIVGLSACQPKPEKVVPPAYALVIHGGAGLIKAENMTPEADSSYRASLLEPCQLVKVS